MTKIFKKHFGLLFVLIFVLLASVPLFQSGLFPMHDDEQVARLYDLNESLSIGHFPPRISPNLGFGYGYPFFNFYPSFAYYVGEIFVVLGFGYILSTKLMLFTGFLFAAFFAYLLGKDLFGKWGGIVAAAFYTFAPYHAVDIYVRGAFAEFFSFVFLPLVLWAIYKFSRSMNLIYVVLTAVSICCLILSHNLIFIMFMPFVLMWTTYLIFNTENKLKFMLWIIVGLSLGVGVSAYFSLPSFFEKDFTLIRILTSELADYNLHFVCIHQLWNSFWGYGGSIPSCEDGLSFMVGKIQLIASLVAVVAFIFSFYKKQINKTNFIIPLFAFFLALSMFLAVRQSSVIWDLVGPLSYIQFPWRFLTLCVLFSSVLAGSIMMFIKDKKYQIGIALVLIALVIGFNFQYFKPSSVLNVKDEHYTNIEKIRWKTSSLAYEYVPSKIATKKSKENTTKIAITQEEIAKSPYSIIKGLMTVRVLADKPHEKVFEINSLTTGILRINTFSFPGWKVFVNGNETKFTDNNKLVLIDVDIPEGNITVKAVFEDTPIRKLGNFVTILSIIGLCVIGIGGLRNGRGNQKNYEKTN